MRTSELAKPISHEARRELHRLENDNLKLLDALERIIEWKKHSSLTAMDAECMLQIAEEAIKE